MVGRRGVALFAAALLFAAAAPGAIAEPTTSIDLEIINAVAAQDDESVATGLGTATVEFSDASNRVVRPRLQIESAFYEVDGRASALFTVPRAEVKWRLPLSESYTARFTAGRSRLSWGDGVVFNAGDVINGAEPNTLDLTASVLRDETVWLLSGYFPLGRYAFFEPLLLIPGLELTAGTDPAAVAPVGADKSGGGFRLQWKTGQVKSETGYVYRGSDESHAPYLSLQGNLYVDWYAAVSTRVTTGEVEEDGGVSATEAKGGNATVGLYHIAQGPRGGSWSFRLEGIVRAGGDPALFPEVTWGPSDLFTTFLRSTIVLDGESSASAVGVNWTPATGLTLALFGSLATGTETGSGLAGSVVDPEVLSDEPLTTVTALIRYSF